MPCERGFGGENETHEWLGRTARNWEWSREGEGGTWLEACSRLAPLSRTERSGPLSYWPFLGANDDVQLGRTPVCLMPDAFPLRWLFPLGPRSRKQGGTREHAATCTLPHVTPLTLDYSPVRSPPTVSLPMPPRPGQ